MTTTNINDSFSQYLASTGNDKLIHNELINYYSNIAPRTQTRIVVQISSAAKYRHNKGIGNRVAHQTNKSTAKRGKVRIEVDNTSVQDATKKSESKIRELPNLMKNEVTNLSKYKSKAQIVSDFAIAFIVDVLGFTSSTLALLVTFIATIVVDFIFDYIINK